MRQSLVTHRSSFLAHEPERRSPDRPVEIRCWKRADHSNSSNELTRRENSDLAVISANLNSIQTTFDQANKGNNPLGVARNGLVFDIDPTFLDFGSTAQIGTRAVQALLHFDQIYERALKMIEQAQAVWDNANEDRNRLRQVANSETEFRNQTFQEDLSYRNDLIRIFGKPYEGTIGPGKLYPAGNDPGSLTALNSLVNSSNSLDQVLAQLRALYFLPPASGAPYRTDTQVLFSNATTLASFLLANAFTTDEDTALVMASSDVLANDTDVDRSDVLTVKSVASRSHEGAAVTRARRTFSRAIRAARTSGAS